MNAKKANLEDVFIELTEGDVDGEVAAEEAPEEREVEKE